MGSEEHKEMLFWTKEEYQKFSEEMMDKTVPYYAFQMIGVNKRIIAFDNAGAYLVMLNPVIVRCSGPYEAEEGCLSLSGRRKAKRFQTIQVQRQNERFQTRLKTFTGWTAEIIQYEMDHCDGTLI